MYSLQVEQPKAVKGLSSMQFLVNQWKEIAISEDKEALKEYARKFKTKTRIVERYGGNE